MNHIVTVMMRHGESKALFQLSKERFCWRFPNANRAVTLDVGMATYGTKPGTFATNMAVHQQKIHHFLNHSDAVSVLGEPHRPAGDGSV